jgi:phosphoribosyl-AMP cyclohydrolase
MIELDFEKQNGLIPAIAQDAETGEVLMLAYMNREAWELTLKTGFAHYWSRSRKEIWKKGESSGNIQEVREVRTDCDTDVILLKVHQVGDAACHTGYRSCFFNLVKDGRIIEDGVKIFDPSEVYGNK